MSLSKIFRDQSSLMSEHGYYITQTTMSSRVESTNYEYHFQEEQRFFNSNIVWEEFPKDRMGTRKLVEMLIGLAHQRVRDEYLHLAAAVWLT